MKQRKTRAPIFWLILALIIYLFALNLKPSAEKYWLYASGAVIPNGTSTHSFSGGTWTYSYSGFPDVYLLSAVGERWVSSKKAVRAKAYYALVILPRVPLRENGSSSSNDGRTQISTLKWLRENSPADERQNTAEKFDLSVTYNAIFQAVTIDSENYSLTKGNLFVIRINEELQPQVTQLDAIIREDNEFAVIEYFKRTVPDEETLQKIF